MTELKPCRVGNYHHNGNPIHELFRDNKELFNVWQSTKSRCESIKISPYTVYWWIREKGIEYAEKRLSEIA